MCFGSVLDMLSIPNQMNLCTHWMWMLKKKDWLHFLGAFLLSPATNFERIWVFSSSALYRQRSKLYLNYSNYSTLNQGIFCISIEGHLWSYIAPQSFELKTKKRRIGSKRIVFFSMLSCFIWNGLEQRNNQIKLIDMTTDEKKNAP